MNLADLIQKTRTCPARRATSNWRCGLPAGHRGPHAAIKVSYFDTDDVAAA